MIFEMNLNASPYEKIASGSKTVELRLFDAKRRRIDIGDKIVFTNLYEPMKKIAVIVRSLHRYASFLWICLQIFLLKSAAIAVQILRIWLP